MVFALPKRFVEVSLCTEVEVRGIKHPKDVRYDHGKTSDHV